mmetsp:Transcript_20229/g.57865  ORF Transcript_20229/g.57865 Transcript_20229/m.57865 type:complete len:202 (-) Transcript_20229:1050-1655(-)
MTVVAMAMAVVAMTVVAMAMAVSYAIEDVLAEAGDPLLHRVAVLSTHCDEVTEVMILRHILDRCVRYAGCGGPHEAAAVPCVLLDPLEPRQAALPVLDGAVLAVHEAHEHLRWGHLDALPLPLPQPQLNLHIVGQNRTTFFLVSCVQDGVCVCLEVSEYLLSGDAAAEGLPAAVTRQSADQAVLQLTVQPAKGAQEADLEC